LQSKWWAVRANRSYLIHSVDLWAKTPPGTVGGRPASPVFACNLLNNLYKLIVQFCYEARKILSGSPLSRFLRKGFTEFSTVFVDKAASSPDVCFALIKLGQSACN
jgi:hypothetical protein